MAGLIAAFGEVMLRLAPPDAERILQSARFVATFGGGEANVAVSLAHFGLAWRLITVQSSQLRSDIYHGHFRQRHEISG
ncbi:MAG TPA: hypothetical protein VF283_13195 [Bryobacteraceae bacterium]